MILSNGKWWKQKCKIPKFWHKNNKIDDMPLHCNDTSLAKLAKAKLEKSYQNSGILRRKVLRHPNKLAPNTGYKSALYSVDGTGLPEYQNYTYYKL